MLINAASRVSLVFPVRSPLAGPLGMPAATANAPKQNNSLIDGATTREGRSICCCCWTRRSSTGECGNKTATQQAGNRSCNWAAGGPSGCAALQLISRIQSCELCDCHHFLLLLGVFVRKKTIYYFISFSSSSSVLRSWWWVLVWRQSSARLSSVANYFFHTMLKITIKKCKNWLIFKN